MQIEVSKSFTLAFFQNQILKLTGKKRSARVRFTAFREDGGLYTPKGNKLNFLIGIKKIQQKNYVLSEQGLTISIFDDIPLTYNKLSSLKTTNSLPYILAAKYRKNQKTDDVLLLNNRGRIAEGSSSNVFIWNGKELITPPLKEACIAGVIRTILLERSVSFNIKCKEGKIKTEDLKTAKAVFLTNSIQGVKWVRNFDKKTYNKRTSKKIGNILLEILNNG